MESGRDLENLSQFKADQNKHENREQSADNLLNFLETEENIGFLHGKKFDAVFSDEKNKREFIKNLSEEDFTEMLNSINGILRNKGKADWGMDGEKVVLTGLSPDSYIHPQQEDKTELLSQVLDAVKIMNEEKKDIKDIALLVSSSINAVHSYSDANGRTSRAFYLLFSEKFDNKTKKELKEVLSEDGRFKIDINPGFIQDKIEDLIKKEIGLNNQEINKDKITNWFGSFTREEIKFDEKNAKRGKDRDLFVELSGNDRQNIFWSMFEFLRDNPDVNKEGRYLKKFPTRENFPDRVIILADDLLKNLDQKQLVQILENYKRIKKRYVEILIDCLANPEKPEYQTRNDNGEKISFKDYFELKIKEESAENAKEKSRKI